MSVSVSVPRISAGRPGMDDASWLLVKQPSIAQAGECPIPFDVPLYFSSAQTGKFIHPLGGQPRTNANLCFHDGGQGEPRISLIAEDAGDGRFYLKSGANESLYVHPQGGVANRDGVGLLFHPGGGEERLAFKAVSKGGAGAFALQNAATGRYVHPDAGQANRNNGKLVWWHGCEDEDRIWFKLQMVEIPEGHASSPEPEPETALAPLPAIPPSPVLGRTLSNSHFKVAYTKTKAPSSMLKLGLKLGDVIQYHCNKNKIPFDDDEGERFFEEIQDDMREEDTVDEAVQRMWTSYRTLHGKEICFMLNAVVRDDPEDGVAPTAALTRAINKMCVTAGKDVVHPPDGVCYRGGGFNDEYRDFFAPGRDFRQPAFLATSFLEETAHKFIRMRGDDNCVLWRVYINPEHGCKHVNVVTRVVPGLADEQEYLFAPYSAFTVLRAVWNTGSSDDPHVIELSAAVDNKEASEDLPLAPWS